MKGVQTGEEEVKVLFFPCHMSLYKGTKKKKKLYQELETIDEFNNIKFQDTKSTFKEH